MARFPLISRRQMWVVGGSLGAAAVLGGGFAWLHPPAPGLLLLCEDECEIVEALARVLFPPGMFPVHGGDGHTAPLVDQVLAREVDPISATPFRYLLRSVQLGTLISRGRRFTDLGPDEARSVVDVWSSGAVFPRRLMSDSLQVVLGMAFFRRPEVIEAIGWHQSCPMPPRGPDPRPGWTG